jgi:hypothetical protein
VMLHRGLGMAADTKDPSDPRQAYRFVIKADDGETTAIRGLITVDKKHRMIERERTPFEFPCEAGSVFAGYFEAADPNRTLRLKVFDPAHSRRRAAPSYEGAARIPFSCAQPGVRPRCADAGAGPCPKWTPSVDEFRKPLQPIQESR